MKESGQHEEEEVVEEGAGLDVCLVKQGKPYEVIRLNAVPLLIKLVVEEVICRNNGISHAISHAI